MATVAVTETGEEWVGTSSRLPGFLESARGSDPSTHRVISLLAAGGLLWPMLRASSDVISVPSAGAAGIALVGGTLLLCCLIVQARTEARLQRLDRWLLALGLLVIAGWAASILSAGNGYVTDEAALTQGASRLLIHGHDPYGANLTSSLFRYSVPPQFWTYTMTGGYVTTYGYPALPLILTAPLVWLLGDGQAVAFAGVAALMLTTVVLYRLLPAGWRGLAVLTCVAIPSLTEFATAGLNVVVMLPFLLVALHRWSATGASGRLNRADNRRAVALGLAMSTNQLAWFLAPFILGGVYVLRRGQVGSGAALRLVSGFFGFALATFTLLNLPFAIGNPAGWLTGVVAPLTQHAIPYGQGIVGLSVFMHVGGGATDAFSYAGALLYLALLAIFMIEIRLLASCCVLFPLLALFVSGRSLAEYWMVLVPAMVVAAASPMFGAPRVRTGGRIRALRMHRSLLVGVLLAPAAGCLAWALLTPAPLAIRVLAAHSGKSTFAVDRLQVLVHNRSARNVRPRFETDSSGQASPFWRVLAGPGSIAPGGAAKFELVPVTAATGPKNGVPFLVQVTTDEPRAISSSARYTQPGPVASSW